MLCFEPFHRRAQQLRDALSDYFNFYNGYDPVFTWWMGMPFQQLDAALQGYALFLRQLAVPAGASTPRATAAPIAAAPASAIAEVPDLEALLRLPQDEMTPIVERFVTPPAADRADTAPGGSRGNAAGGRAATNNPGSGRPKQHYIDWLAALKTLDFDRLSRNGQVDYLLRVVVPDIERYDAFYKKLIAKIELSDVSSSFAMEQIKFTTALPLDYAVEERRV